MGHYEHSGPEGQYDEKMCQNGRHHRQKAHEKEKTHGDGDPKLSPHGYRPGFGKRVCWQVPEKTYRLWVIYRVWELVVNWAEEKTDAVK